MYFQDKYNIVLHNIQGVNSILILLLYRIIYRFNLSFSFDYAFLRILILDSERSVNILIL